MKIRTLRLPTCDPARLQTFYGEVLSLPWRRDGGLLTVQVGSSVLEFEAGASGQPQHFAFNVPPDRFAETKAWLAARTTLHRDAGGDDEFGFEDWQARAAYFRDPDGHILEIIARQTLVTSAPGPLLSISEVGLAVADVEGTVAALEGIGLSPYREPSPTFAAMGDERGLLIVVPAHRLWFPDTGVPATPISGYTEIEIDARSHRISCSEGRLRID